jgi:hypothetical protein
VEERFVLLSANDPFDVDWTVSLLHFAKYAGIGRVLQLRGAHDEGPRVREISRECRATGVRLDAIWDHTVDGLHLEKDRDGSYVLEYGMHLWKSGSSVIWGGKQITMLGSPAAVGAMTQQRLAQHSPAGADIVLRGLDLSPQLEAEEALRTREHSWRLLRQLRPLLHVHATVGVRVDSIDSLDGRTLVQCGLSTTGGSSVAVLDLRAIQVLD